MPFREPRVLLIMVGAQVSGAKAKLLGGSAYSLALIIYERLQTGSVSEKRLTLREGEEATRTVKGRAAIANVIPYLYLHLFLKRHPILPRYLIFTPKLLRLGLFKQIPLHCHCY